MIFELSMEDLVVLDKALQEMPYRVASPLIKKINEQIVKQQETAVSSEATGE